MEDKNFENEDDIFTDDLLEGEDKTPFDGTEGIEGSPKGEEGTTPTTVGKEGEGTQPSQPKVDEPFLKIKHLDKDLDLTKDKAIELSQKGMDYDRVREKYDEMKPYKDDIDVIRKYAEEGGKSVHEFVESVSQAHKKFEIETEFQNLKSQYPDASDEILMKLATSEVNAKHAEKSESSLRAEQEQRDAQEKAQKEQVQKDIEQFKKEFPDVNLDDIKSNEQVLEYIKDGYSLVTAYYKWLNVKQKPITDAQQKASQKNSENSQKGLGSLDTAGGSEGDDPLMQGLDSDE